MILKGRTILFLLSADYKKENEPTMCEAFHELTEYFVKHLDYKDTEGVFLVSKIHRETLKENYDLKR